MLKKKGIDGKSTGVGRSGQRRKHSRSTQQSIEELDERIDGFMKRINTEASEFLSFKSMLALTKNDKDPLDNSMNNTWSSRIC